MTKFSLAFLPFCLSGASLFVWLYRQFAEQNLDRVTLPHDRPPSPSSLALSVTRFIRGLSGGARPSGRRIVTGHGASDDPGGGQLIFTLGAGSCRADMRFLNHLLDLRTEIYPDEPPFKRKFRISSSAICLHRSPVGFCHHRIKLVYFAVYLHLGTGPFFLDPTSPLPDHFVLVS